MGTTFFLGLFFFLLLSISGLLLMLAGNNILSRKNLLRYLAPILHRAYDKAAISRWIGSTLMAEGSLSIGFALIVLFSPTKGFDLLSIWAGLFVLLAFVALFGVIQHYIHH